MNGLLTLPRVSLAVTPTPLQPAPRLSEELGVEVWLKRDDLTGLGLGGNKTRGLEYLLAEAIAQGCDCLVTGAGPQSNWAMLAALAARRCGLDPYLVFYGSPVPVTGNLLLDQMVGADVRFTGDPDRASVDVAIQTLADELRAAGRRPYVLPRGGATALGAVGYVRASLELAEQLLAAGLTPSRLWLATGSCGTQAGLVAGARWLRAPYQVVGVTVSRPAEECVARVLDLAGAVAELLDLPGADVRGDVTVLGGYLGPGYGRRSPEGEAAAQLVARTEGVFLDPVFSAKAMACLIDAARAGGLAGPVVFLVTGGAPTLFNAVKSAL
ncbi:cysteine desulfhydrase [Carbonactinospora thermoautotrophica]|uniref:1-aminocyclopropane-1-carboxylate deaminase n=1 Tax=Carbonactinospora thermoautotrophica TaxID=1469144 RepID=A0A132MT40_9ACTN|nr:pyridoxal-phosphate dependent enzyme [Carbonactinospora thermoautotrophica]KWX01055.1 1-aminocyclopropane-1-carboxylate deaminase [Carbonactinospora thermoautotrophica]KWX04727.1 cysteine desulfhydrase [Carbonactinospora thermoautotrophica]KWX05195.1 cysteine desulfhydrase [Carbonactinospora thermoautotrophica]